MKVKNSLQIMGCPCCLFPHGCISPAGRWARHEVKGAPPWYKGNFWAKHLRNLISLRCTMMHQKINWNSWCFFQFSFVSVTYLPITCRWNCGGICPCDFDLTPKLSGTFAVARMYITYLCWNSFGLSPTCCAWGLAPLLLLAPLLTHLSVKFIKQWSKEV